MTPTSLTDRAMQAALSNKSPVELYLNDQFWLTAHAETDCIIVSVGPHQTSQTNIMRVLQKRADQPKKFGPWLPAMLTDERLVVLRKVPKLSSGVTSFPDDELTSALELLS